LSGKSWKRSVTSASSSSSSSSLSCDDPWPCPCADPAASLASPEKRYESSRPSTTLYKRSPSSRRALNMRSSPSTPGSVSCTAPRYSAWSETRSERRPARNSAEGEGTTVGSIVCDDRGEGRAGMVDEVEERDEVEDEGCVGGRWASAAAAGRLDELRVASDAGRFVAKIDPTLYALDGVSAPAEPLLAAPGAAPPPPLAAPGAARVRSGNHRSRTARWRGRTRTVRRKAISASASSSGMSCGRVGRPGGTV